MNTFVIEHKHCKMIMHIKGNTIWDAFRANQLDTKQWKVIG